ncbi:MAG: hypothetical protein A3B47_02280 [Candidatus Levybacteria bacterium RIFCSPLOWO2_01_FULL_39_24]|nr:MAG: hypothetical protein A2800_01575 [Candidatus Levybacteria bacterium RIFCSPHIGHO2_01_FULL_40_16]OGH28378.1 MAG: hypothetical protein A3E12_01855 [Candidatus Levybacteria bacterium RIFCSPHIGHO2_12_FULL_39_9]OGH46463.1 MAG: hypothetical protein A3B47_02280 [Candidatus Levybacteria bacterium RIFCSPLOWO2_01_FULL_39_24]
MSQIRLTKTPELEGVLAFLRNKYRLLSEAEIIKISLAEKYLKEVNIPLVDEATEKLIAKGLQNIKEGEYTDVKTEEELDNYLRTI